MLAVGNRGLQCVTGGSPNREAISRASLCSGNEPVDPIRNCGEEAILVVALAILALIVLLGVCTIAAIDWRTRCNEPAAHASGM